MLCVALFSLNLPPSPSGVLLPFFNSVFQSNEALRLPLSHVNSNYANSLFEIICPLPAKETNASQSKHSIPPRRSASSAATATAWPASQSTCNGTDD